MIKEVKVIRSNDGKVMLYWSWKWWKLFQGVQYEERVEGDRLLMMELWDLFIRGISARFTS